MKRHLYHALCLLLCATPAAARPLINLGLSDAHEISAHLGMGLSTFSYKLSEGKSHVGMGGTFGLGYAYFFNDFLGINTGLGIDLYNAKAGVRGGTTAVIPNYITDYFDEEDGRTINITLRSSLSGYTERQRAFVLTIPVLLQFPPAAQWYGKVGVKVGIPFSVRYRTTAATLTNDGYYEGEDNKMPPLAKAGIGEFPTDKGKSKLKLTPSFMLSVEGGMKFPLPRELTLYAGIYCDYGLNDVGQGRTRYAAYDNPEADPAHFMPSSVLTSYRPADADNGTNRLFTKRVVPLSVGLKATVVLGGASGSKANASPRFFNDWQLTRTGGKSSGKGNVLSRLLKW